MEKNPYELRDYLSILWQRKKIIFAVMGIVVAASLLFSFRQPRLYKSSAEVHVYPVYLPIAGASGGQSFIPMENELRVAESASVSELAAASMPPGQPLAGISVSNPTDTQVLVFTSTSDAPVLAQATAQSYASAYLESRRETFVGSAQNASGALEAQIAELEAEYQLLNERFIGAETDAERSGLQTQIGVVLGQKSDKESLLSQLELVEQISVGTILVDAYYPVAPSSPDHRRALMLGLFVGLALGVAVALVLERLDPRLRGREDVQAAALAPVAAYITHDDRLGTSQAFDPSTDAHVADGFRTLRTRVLFAASQSEARTLLITSAIAGEGKTTTAANLAVALARADVSVILVGADIHRPDLHRYFPRLPARGLADLLAGTYELSELEEGTKIPNLTVIPSGTPGVIPEGALSSPAMHELLDGLKERAEMIIIDSPPVLGTSDALDLAPLVEKVLLVTDVQITTRDSLAEASREVRSVGGDVMGVVLGNIDARRLHPQYRSYTSNLPPAQNGNGEQRRPVDTPTASGAHAEGRPHG